jgi:FAD/FMN-containing dehydrogenase/Fe-S oxidoreductase
MTLSAMARSALALRFRRQIEGDVLFDEFSRGRYATDASPYQTFPAGVILPKTQGDILAAMSLAWEAGIPITARGGGTGRAGQAVSEGLIIDVSKYLTRLLYYDASAQTCIVEPGIRPVELNKALRPERVWFPVEIASAAQATIGGMAATDAIGGRTLRYGRMRDNIAACDGVLAHGEEMSFGEVPENFGEKGAPGQEHSFVLDLLETAESQEALIRSLADFPGGVQGYNVSALLPGKTPQNLAVFLAGSEGTLAVLKRIELKLARWPRGRALGVCHFSSIAAALRAIPGIRALEPSGIELSGRGILELGLAGDGGADLARRVLKKEAEALLFVEFMEGNRVANARKLRDLMDLMAQLGHIRAVTELIGAAVQNATQRAHRNGLARLYGATVRARAFAPVEEVAFPLRRLAAGAEAIAAIFARRGLDVVWHGHAGVGALHLRPWLRAGDDSSGLKAAAEEVAAVLKDFATDSAPAEGHGIARSYAREAARDPRLTQLFEAIKTHFDPQNRLNPGKIVFTTEPRPEFLRSTPPASESPSLSALNCDGSAFCRRLNAGLMCPSFRLTRDERDSPRGRANTLRLALSGDLGADGLASGAMAETMSLCVSCKACRSECPRAADIAQARIAAQAARVGRTGLTSFERSAAFLPHYAPRLRHWRHILNLRDILPWTATLSEKLTGISADRPWPRWTSAPFTGRGSRADGETLQNEILFFPDTFNSYFDAVTLRSAADVLTASGFHLHLLEPPEEERPYCCGRTFLEMGLIEEARVEARRLIRAVKPFIDRGVPLVGVEPACMLTLRDEFVNILAEEGAQELASKSLLFEEVMSQEAVAEALKPHLLKIEAEALVVAHCHQHAFGTAALSRKVAATVPGMTVIEAEKVCCGMGTTFGYRPEAIEPSLRMGELALFPQIRRAGRDTLVIADGFACRKQILDGTGRTARHSAVLLKLALAAKEKFGREAEQTLAKDGKLAKRLSRLRRDYFR